MGDLNNPNGSNDAVDQQMQAVLDHSTFMKMEGDIHEFLKREMDEILKNRNQEIKRLQTRVKILASLLIVSLVLLSSAASWFAYDFGVEQAQNSMGSLPQSSEGVRVLPCPTEGE